MSHAEVYKAFRQYFPTYVAERLLHGFQTDGTRFEFEKQTAMNLYFRLITEKTGSSRQLTVF